jgi:hypothetical protein
MAAEPNGRTGETTAYDWSLAGEEWSEPWGSSAAQWYGAILPRIHECLPAGTLLEIAPGFGRWTHYLKDFCDHVHLVDITEKCIEACHRRFAGDARFSYHVNDGTSLGMIPDQSVDFIFSFDSLVHVNAVTLETYVSQFAAKLKPDGLAFIHHSNLGEYAAVRAERLPGPFRKLLTNARLLPPHRGRAPDMTAERFRSYCGRHALQCLAQETVNWRSRQMTDCFSLVGRIGGEAHRPFRLTRNPYFMWEAELIKRWAPNYNGVVRPRSSA